MDMTPPIEGYLTPQQVAARLGIDAQAVYARLRANDAGDNTDIPGVRKINDRFYLVPVEALKSFMATPSTKTPIQGKRSVVHVNVYNIQGKVYVSRPDAAQILDVTRTAMYERVENNFPCLWVKRGKRSVCMIPLDALTEEVAQG